MRFSRFGQSVIEYAILLALVTSAIVAMQVYMKRGVQAKVKDMTDAMLPPGAVDAGVTQLAHTNPVIPMLDESTGLSQRSQVSLTDSLTTADGGSTLVRDIEQDASYELKMGTKDPAKDVTGAD